MPLLNLIITIAIGMGAGYIANKVMKLNFGLLFCFVIGIIGAVVGYFLFGVLSVSLGLGSSGIMFSRIGQFITSTIGSIVLLWLYVYFKRK